MAASVLCGNDVHGVIVFQFIFKKNVRKKTLNLNYKCASQVPLYREFYDPGYEHDGCGVCYGFNFRVSWDVSSCGSTQTVTVLFFE